MFGGIVESAGLVLASHDKSDCLKLVIKPEIPFDDVAVGDSVSVNGVCLTVTSIIDNQFSVDVVPETLQKTNLGQLAVGTFINLERSLKLQSRMGGHYVQGHVDFVAEILSMRRDSETTLIAELSYPSQFSNYLVNKGYVTIDGMSITIIEVGEKYFSVTFIPHTQDVTIVKSYSQGSKVNVEVDILGKYVEKILMGKRQ